MIATDCSYLFEYTSFSNFHKVFLIKCTGTAEPKNEIKHLAYFNGSNVNVSDTTKKIIERYHGVKNSTFEYAELKCSRCGAGLKVTANSDFLRCSYCGTLHYKETGKPPNL